MDNMLDLAMRGAAGAFDEFSDVATTKSAFGEIVTLLQELGATSYGAAEQSELFASGEFIHANPSDPIHYGSGKVSVYRDLVFLEPDFEVDPGPAFHVYLVPKTTIRESAYVESAMFVDLGKLRAFKGSQKYPIPAHLERFSERGDLVPAVRRPDLPGGPQLRGRSLKMELQTGGIKS